MVDYLTIPAVCSRALKLRIAFTPGAGSLTVMVVNSWNVQIFIILQYNDHMNLKIINRYRSNCNQGQRIIDIDTRMLNSHSN